MFGLSRYLSSVRHNCHGQQGWEGYTLRDRVYLRNFSGIEERVGSTAVGSTDIERENELSRGSVI